VGNLLQKFTGELLDRLQNQRCQGDPGWKGRHGWVFSSTARGLMTEWGIKTWSNQFGFAVMLKSYLELTMRREPDQTILEEYMGRLDKVDHDPEPTESLLAIGTREGWSRRFCENRAKWYIHLARTIRLAVMFASKDSTHAQQTPS